MFFVHGFGKNERGNIDGKEERALKKFAKEMGKLSQDDIETAVEAGALIEVDYECD